VKRKHYLKGGVLVLFKERYLLNLRCASLMKLLGMDGRFLALRGVSLKSTRIPHTLVISATHLRTEKGIEVLV